MPIAIHLLNNGLVALLVMNADFTQGLEAATSVAPVAITLAAVCVLAFSGLAMWHSRARLTGEALRGTIVPPETSDVRVVDAPPHLLFTLAAAGFSAALIWLLVG